MRYTLRALCLSFAICAVSTPSSGQAPGAPAIPACIDKVRISAFTLTDAALPMNKKVTLKISNLCVGTAAALGFSVPWRITVGGQRILLASGLMLIAPGATAFASTNWPMTAGIFSFEGEADPENTLHEPAAARANNLSDVLQIAVKPKSPVDQ